MSKENQKEQGDRPVPPYGPYKTFSSFVDSLDPEIRHIDRSMMPRLSGVMQGRLISTLKFLDLIDSEGNVTNRLQEYLKARGNEEQRVDRLTDIIGNGYGLITDELDIKTCSSAKLKEAFKQTGIEGSTLTDAIRFFIKACQDARMPLSNYLLTPQPRTRKNGSGVRKSERPKRSNDKGNGKTVTTHKPKEEDLPEGTIRFPIYFKNKPQGSLTVPAELTGADVRVIELMIPMLRAYAGDGTE